MKVNMRRIAGIIPEMTPVLAGLVSVTLGAGEICGGGTSACGAATAAGRLGLGVRGFVSGKSATPKRLLSAAITPVAGTTARRHVAKNQMKRVGKRDITKTTKDEVISYKRPR